MTTTVLLVLAIAMTLIFLYARKQKDSNVFFLLMGTLLIGLFVGFGVKKTFEKKSTTPTESARIDSMVDSLTSHFSPFVLEENTIQTMVLTDVVELLNEPTSDTLSKKADGSPTRVLNKWIFWDSS